MDAIETSSVMQVTRPKTPPNTLSGISFPEINHALDQSSLAISGSKPGPWERRSFVIGIAGAGMAILLGTLLPGRFGQVAAALGIAVEALGLLTSLALQIKRDWRHFRHARTQHAEEIEQGYLEHQLLVRQLSNYPLEQRQNRLRYIRNRQVTMHERLGLFTGGMERLGVFPLLLALYLQFKDWRWGDWQAINDINLIQGLLAFMLMIAYASFWHLIHLRTRVQTYEQLLSQSVEQEISAS